MRKIKVLEITDINNELTDEAKSRQYHCFSYAQGYVITADYFVTRADGKSINVNAEAVKLAMEYSAELRKFYFVVDADYDAHFLYNNEFYFYQNEYYYTPLGPIFADRYDAKLYELTARMHKLYCLHHAEEDFEGFQELMLKLVGRQEVA